MIEAKDLVGKFIWNVLREDFPVKIVMVTEIIDGGSSGIVPTTRFHVYQMGVEVLETYSLDDAIAEYNRRLNS